MHSFCHTAHSHTNCKTSHIHEQHKWVSFEQRCKCFLPARITVASLQQCVAQKLTTGINDTAVDLPANSSVICTRMVSEWILPQFCIFHQLVCVHSLQNQGPSCEAKMLHSDIFRSIWAVLCLRQLAAGLSPWRPRSDRGPVHVGFVVDHIVLRTGFSHSTIFLPWQYNSTIAPHLFIHSFIHPSLMLHNLSYWQSFITTLQKENFVIFH
jgi:hypothetical protein